MRFFSSLSRARTEFYHRIKKIGTRVERGVAAAAAAAAFGLSSQFRLYPLFSPAPSSTYLVFPRKRLHQANWEMPATPHAPTLRLNERASLPENLIVVVVGKKLHPCLPRYLPTFSLHLVALSSDAVTSYWVFGEYHRAVAEFRSLAARCWHCHFTAAAAAGYVSASNPLVFW